MSATAHAHDVETAKRNSTLTVITASAMGTAFEWYDFFIFGTLTAIISKHFFAFAGETAGAISTLLTFAAGFFARPFGAIVFGRIGDRVGRKRAFLVTITIMGLATFVTGLIPTYEQVGVLAPVLLISLRLLQGFALGGEYGGAAIYVAEHAPANRRGLHTGAIQTSAAFGLFGALGVILLTRTTLGEITFADWGWRIPFIVSLGLLVISIWIRLHLEESPVFKKIKAEGTASRAPLRESFFEWRNLKIVLLALVAIMMAQGVVWYTGHFYSQFFMTQVLKVEPKTVNLLMITVTAISAMLYVFFAWLSDRIGRKPVMLFGIALATIAFFPGFQALTKAANPALAAAQEKSPVSVVAAPSDCTFQFDPFGLATFVSSCDIAKTVLTNAGVNYTNVGGETGALAQVRIGETVVASVEGRGLAKPELAAARKDFEARLKAALSAAGYPEKAEPNAMDTRTMFAILMIFIVAATALYGPQAAALVELFPTRIRYTALSLPYHIGTGWFGGFQPFTSFAIVVATGNIYAGLWYPVVIAAISFLAMLFVLPETHKRSITD